MLQIAPVHKVSACTAIGVYYGVSLVDGCHQALGVAWPALCFMPKCIAAYCTQSVVSRCFYSAGIGCRRVADAVWLLLIQNGATSAQGLFCAQYWTCTTAALQQTSQSIDFSYLAEAF